MEGKKGVDTGMAAACQSDSTRRRLYRSFRHFLEQQERLAVVVDVDGDARRRPAAEQATRRPAPNGWCPGSAGHRAGTHQRIEALLAEPGLELVGEVGFDLLLVELGFGCIRNLSTTRNDDVESRA